jgi:cytochrome c
LAVVLHPAIGIHDGRATDVADRRGVRKLGVTDAFIAKGRKDMTARNTLFVAATSLVGMIGMAQQSFAADAAAGKATFEHKCHVCHRIGPGATNFVGPNLSGLDGRAIASEAGYDYSAADQAKKKTSFVWNAQTFDTYITNPAKDIPGTKMIFPGLAKASDRADLWAYISQFKADGSMK